jgi:hypothetical protein
MNCLASRIMELQDRNWSRMSAGSRPRWWRCERMDNEPATFRARPLPLPEAAAGPNAALTPAPADQQSCLQLSVTIQCRTLADLETSPAMSQFWKRYMP